jgi:aspartyl-tRNA synthetase
MLKDRILVKELAKHIGQEGSVYGWVHGVRKQGSLVFILVRDISGIVQVVVTKEAPEALELAKELKLESVIKRRETGTIWPRDFSKVTRGAYCSCARITDSGCRKKCVRSRATGTYGLEIY